MKKLLSIMLMLALMAAGLAACGGGQKEEVPEDEPVQVATDTVVIYFSATGNTKAVAEKIAAARGADIYEIVPAEPYSAADIDYGDEARATAEQNDPDCRPEIGGKDIDLSKYYNILIGYPIWYGSEPRIMDTFVESHSLEGKRVIPFCTSDSSDIADSEKSLAKVAGSGDWQEGKRFAADASDDEISEWVDGLGLDFRERLEQPEDQVDQ